jgi:hypothetical protein
MRGIGLNDISPERAGATIHREQAGDGVDAELEILVADEQQRRDVARVRAAPGRCSRRRPC